jgi:hypothetical protein
MKKSFLLLSCFFAFFLGTSAQEGNITVEKTQKSLITKRTATWCPICGNTDVWPMVKNLNAALQDKALVIAGHHSDGSDLYRPVAEDFINNFETSFGQPRFYFNQELIGAGNSSTESTLNGRAEAAAQNPPLAQAGLLLTFDESQQQLSIDGQVNFYDNTSGNYRLGYYAIRKSVIAAQSNQGPDTEHINVLWDAITEGSFGIEIPSETLVTEGSFLYQESYTLSEGLNIENLLIAAIIWKENEDGKYDIVNVEYSDNIQTSVVSSTLAFTELETFLIQPTLTTQNSSLAKIKLSSPLNNFELSIFNMQGQKIRTVYRGSLGSGEHHFLLEVPGTGVYLVALRKDLQISTQRLIRLP